MNVLRISLRSTDMNSALRTWGSLSGGRLRLGHIPSKLVSPPILYFTLAACSRLENPGDGWRKMPDTWPPSREDNAASWSALGTKVT